MPKKQTPQGFTAVEALIIVLVVAIVGLGGWYVWHKNKKQDTNKSNNQISQSQNKADQKPADPSEGGKYLVISEWGVRLPLPEKLVGDVYYDYSPAPSTKNPSVTIESAKLRSKALDRITADCKGNKFYLGTVARSKDKPSSDEYDYTQADLNFIQINGYWYHNIDRGNEAAATQECSNPTNVSKEKDTFWTSIGGAQAVYDSVMKLEATKQ